MYFKIFWNKVTLQFPLFLQSDWEKNCDLIKSTFSAKNTANIISQNNQQVQLYITFQELKHIHLPLYALPGNLAHFFLLLNCVLETIGEHQQDTSEKKTTIIMYKRQQDLCTKYSVRKTLDNKIIINLYMQMYMYLC